MRRLWLLLLISLFFAGCAKVEPVFKQDINTSYLHLLHNKERGLKKIEQLEYDVKLEQFAQDWAEHMASRRRLRHSDLGFKGYSFKGENIAMGQRTEEEVLKSWMNSRGHRANILNSRYTHVGFGCARTQSGTLYWCACFGGNR